MATCSFSFLPLGNLTVAYENAYLHAGSASHRLSLRFDVAATWLDPEDFNAVVPVLITGTAWTTMPGPLRPLPGLHTSLFAVRGYALQEHLYIDVSDDELTAIEEARAGGEIEINFKLQATLLRAEPSIHPVMTQDFGVRIAQSRWVELLDGVGRAVGITLRIPSPLTDLVVAAQGVNDPTVASLTQAATRLREARRQLRELHWEQSVATCRKVLENIASINPMPTQKEIQGVVAKERNKRLRWAAMYYDVLSLTHPAAHDEGVQLTYGAVDAEAILAATASLLHVYSCMPGS